MADTLRIRAALDLGLQSWRSTPTRERFHAAFAELRVLEAEVARLRAALEQIAESYPWVPYMDEEYIGPYPADDGERFPTNRRIAREALDGGETGARRPSVSEPGASQSRGPSGSPPSSV